MTDINCQFMYECLKVRAFVKIIEFYSETGNLSKSPVMDKKPRIRAVKGDSK